MLQKKHPETACMHEVHRKDGNKRAVHFIEIRVVAKVRF